MENSEEFAIQEIINMAKLRGTIITFEQAKIVLNKIYSAIDDGIINGSGECKEMPTGLIVTHNQ